MSMHCTAMLVFMLTECANRPLFLAYGGAKNPIETARYEPSAALARSG